MIALVFQPERIPRTTTRAQWREIDRWRRVTEKKLADQRAQALLAFRVLGPERSIRLAERLINPAVMIYPELTP